MTWESEAKHLVTQIKKLRAKLEPKTKKELSLIWKNLKNFPTEGSTEDYKLHLNHSLKQVKSLILSIEKDIKASIKLAKKKPKSSKKPTVKARKTAKTVRKSPAKKVKKVAKI